MLLPICEECYKKIIATKDGNIVPFPYQEPNMSVKEYHKLFQVYLLAKGSDDITIERKNILFVYGLTDENKKKVSMLPFLSAQLKSEDFIEKIVIYLSEVDLFNSAIFGKRDQKP